MLNMMSCMLFEVVLLQVKQEQGKSKYGGKKQKQQNLTFIFF